jgi:hypothetical protein
VVVAATIPLAVSRLAAGGGRWVTVAPERIERWLAGFAERHGPAQWSATPLRVVVTAADGARAECDVPFPPLDVENDAAFGGLVAHAVAERTIGVLLVRLGGYAAGVFEGPRLVASKVGSRPVHGRAAAGGWSQHRVARRREAQAHVALEAAADAAADILVPTVAGLDAVVVGGDRRAVDEVLDDKRLTQLRALVTGNVLDVPDPKRAVLHDAHDMSRSVRIRVLDPRPTTPR